MAHAGALVWAVDRDSVRVVGGRVVGVLEGRVVGLQWMARSSVALGEARSVLGVAMGGRVAAVATPSVAGVGVACRGVVAAT